MPSNRHIERYVAPIEETPIAAVDAVDESQKASSVWGDAWKDMRKRWLTWVCLALIAVIAVVAIFPQLFTSVAPYGAACDVLESLEGPRAGHPFGFDLQGCDLYSRVIYGTRTSVSVGLLATVLATLIGGVIGAIAGYYGGWLDSVVSRIGDIFFAIPSVLGAIVVMQVLPFKNVLSLALTLAIFGWPQVARIMRGAVLTSKQADYVMSAVALGVSKSKVLLRHVVPNALAPVIVIATVSLGTFIVAEATLSFLGLGISGGSVVSWGEDISNAQQEIRTTPMLLFYPAAALAVTVLSFLLLGDVVRDALDPKARTRR
jgi:oligopeptide transport system permease protein